MVLTGSSIWGAVADTAAGSTSLAGTTGAASSLVGLETSFLPKKLPKIEFLLFGFAALSREATAAAGLVSVAAVSVAGSTAPVVAVSAAMGSAAPTDLAPSVGTTGSAMTRLATGC